MSPTMNVTDKLQNGFPRVSGDEPDADAPDEEALKFSPRERG